MRAWLAWVNGRQAGGYDKMLLATAKWPLPFDLYLLRFPEGSFISEHKDPVVKGRHVRVNIVIRKAELGGEFVCKVCLLRIARIAIFRPDLQPHSVALIERGTRYVLSFGMLLR